MTVLEERRGPVHIVTINRPESRNAVDRPTADALEQAFRGFDADDEARVAVLAGAGGNFCAGADLKALSSGDPERINRVERSEHAPMGPTRLEMSKPVIAAVEGHAVAGGLELAVWCDLRVATYAAVFGAFERRWGVPLIDGGTARLPRIVGLGHALDLILTGRGVSGEEAQRMGLANRLVPVGQALEAAVELAEELAAFPQSGMRADRIGALRAWDGALAEVLMAEHDTGLASMADGELVEGATKFTSGAGRSGASR